MHSGWGALVAVSNDAGAVEVIERRRFVVASPETPGGKQPYHFAEDFELVKAEKFLGERFADSKRLALRAVQEVIGELRGRQYQVTGAAVLLASGRPLPLLPTILVSHALIHAAEGEFFREVFSKACEGLELPVTGIRERDLDERVRTTFGKAANRILQQISLAGRSLGPPWTADQKTAALAALVVLAKRPGRGGA
jgi:hypothetical protein